MKKCPRNRGNFNFTIHVDEDLSFTVSVQLKRCGMAMWLIVRPQRSEAQPVDKKLVTVISKGQDWFKRLAAGKAESPKDIAEQERCTAPYVIRLIWLAFLAPDIVEKIGRGQQPPDLTATRLLEMVPLPVGWGEQRKLLGMAA